MKEARFIAQNREKWSKMEQKEELNSDTLAANFVELSDDLAFACTFFPGSEVERYLNHLIAGYQANINAGQRKPNVPWLSFWKEEWPLLLAREHRTLLLALFFFVMAAVIGAFSAAHDVAFVRLILGDNYVDMTLNNIREGKPMGVYSSMDQVDMFFYITINNIKVSFIAFIFGLIFSAGTLWILFSNGIMLGAFQYFFYQHGLLLHSVLSVWAHGTFEITSIIVAGGAGLVMGNSFLFPGTYSRMHSFRKGAMRGIKIVAGLVPFFILAGFIESFVTRYADRMPWIGGMTIILSVMGILLYFVVYPYILSRKTSLKHCSDARN